jgi:hypothetical protein
MVFLLRIKFFLEWPLKNNDKDLWMKLTGNPLFPLNIHHQR